MKTLFEAASMVILLAISQFTFLPAPKALTSDPSVTNVSETGPVQLNRPGHMVKPLSL